ncbi:hypothetical protein BB561_000253 [Smittium simulii]|uniref:Uncharacterized protein n=1 Tax=Smittium simulii TaxID=133385 RepID=A0A2T9Z008_9FUNG|nr:hypothetical protein BB561_000253 [Smittium simulii]
MLLAEKSSGIFSFQEKETYYKELIKKILGSALFKSDNNFNFDEEQLEDLKWKQVNDTPSKLRCATKIIEIQIEKYALDLTTQHDCALKLSKILDVAIELTDKDCIDPTFPCALLETVVDCLDIAEIKILMDCVKTKNYFKMISLVTNAGKGQILVRMLNHLLKRVPKYTEAEFRGQIAEFFFLLFKMYDRSGINLKGDFNTSIVLEYEKFEFESQEKVEINTLDNNEILSEEQSDIKLEIQANNNEMGNDNTRLEANTIDDSLPNNDDLKINTENVELKLDEITLDPILDSVKDDFQQNQDVLMADSNAEILESQSSKKLKRFHNLSYETKNLYQEFWGLQSYFKDPPKAFENKNSSKIFKVILLICWQLYGE